MSKFKVGDKVRVTLVDSYDYEYKVGHEFVIEEVEESRFNNSPAHKGKGAGCMTGRHWFYADQLELVESKSKKPKTELRIVYKVTTEDYKSVNNRGCVLEYKLEQKTKTPKDGNPLIAFSNYDTAIRIMMWSLNGSAHILKCVGKVRKDSDFSFLRGVLGDPPVGSVLCDWVFPIEQIK